LPESIFERDGDAFTPTEAALSPWSDQLLHGGPPTMLMVRELERFPSEQPMFVVRLTVELLRPIGRAALTARSRLVRPGRKVQLVEASLWNGDVEVARTTAMRIRTAEVDVPVRDDPPPYPGPEEFAEWTGSWRTGGVYHLLGVEVRSKRADAAAAPGWAWFRLKLPVVPGEEPSPLQRICAAADFPNGISFVVDPRVTTFVNPDLTVYVHRLPVGEWVLVDARSWLERQGTGMAEGNLFDRAGRLGRSLQGLLVEPRS
jgi:Acyl-CoA thioesterase C-terminal domain/Acyl-CoA thioesterase N-terminal domain